jgi:arginase
MKLQVLVVSMDSGVRGWRMGAGPERLLESGALEGLKARDRSPVELLVARYDPPEAIRGEGAIAFDVARWLALHVAQARETGAFPLVLAGNCVSSLGTFTGLRARKGASPGVCWFDAHADFNTPETTPSGFLDGMALATLTGRCWTSLVRSIPGFAPVADENVLLVGARDLDPPEERMLGESGIARVGARESTDVTSAALKTLRARTEEIYLHLDLDVLDISVAKVNRYACAGGFARERLVDLVREIRGGFKIGGAAITAYDPSYDREARIPGIVREIVETLVRGG